MIYFGDFDAGGGVLAAPAPNYYRTVFLMEATGQSNGTGYAAEESRHAWALTYTGNAQITSGLFEFDGTGDYISVADSLLWTPGTKFTMEVINLVLDVVNTGGNHVIVSQYEAGLGSLGWRIYEDSGQLYFNYSANGSSTTAIAIGAVSAGAPYTVAVCWDGSTIYTVLNGAPGGSGSFSGQFFNTSQDLRFGCDFNGGVAQRFLDGRFETFVFTRGEAIYTAGANYTMPTAPRAIDTPSLTDSEWANVVCLIGYDAALSRIRDFGPFDLPLTLNGSIAGTTGVTLADGTPSIAFNGSTQYLSVPDSPIFELGSGNYTIEVQAQHSSASGQQEYVSKWQTGGSNRSYAFGYRPDLTPDTLAVSRSSTGSSAGNAVLGGSFTATTGVFYHMAACRDGGDNRIFRDGVQDGSTNTTTVNLFNGAADFRVGCMNSSGLTGFMNGYLAEIRVTKAARYTAGFTAPTGAFPRG